MSADRDSRLPPGPDDDDFEEEEAPRSIFAVTWFRVVLVLVVVAIVGALAVPYVLDAVNPPATPLIATTPRPAPSPAPSPPATTPTPPAAPAPAPEKKIAQAPATTTAPTATPTPSAPSTPPSATAPAKSRETTAASTPSKPSASTETAKPAAPAKDAEAKAPAKDIPAKTATKDAAPKAAAPAEPKQVAQADRTPAPGARDTGAPTRSAPARTPAAAEGGDYFVQVGAFKDQSVANRVAETVRGQNFPVEIMTVKRRSGTQVAEAPRPAPAPRTGTTPSSGGPDRYDVIVTGGSPSEINTKLAAKGLAAEPSGDGVRIRPSLPLRDAVALSKDLNNDGFKVQVRRGGGGPATTTAPTPAPTRPSTASDADAGSETWYRVRVGGFPDLASAQTAMRTLQGKGYQAFIAKGRD